MNVESALIFGYNEYGIELAKNVTHKYNDITIFSITSIESEVLDENYEVKEFDLSDDWDEISEKYNLKESIIFCALNDKAKNIFLTISLRSVFKEVSIIALADNNEDANKLKMAGASKVIPIVETTASIITDMLRKPIITSVLHDILYEDNKLKVVQIEVEKGSFFDGKYPVDIEWSRDHGVIILSIIHDDMSSEFIYSSKAKHHLIKNGDIFIAVGYEEDLKEFKRLIGTK